MNKLKILVIRAIFPKTLTKLSQHSHVESNQSDDICTKQQSAGVAISYMYPVAKSVGAWIKGGWCVAIGYVLGFFVLLAVMGCDPQEKLGKGAPAKANASSPTDSNDDAVKPANQPPPSLAY
jgi:hypothetical protein